VQTRQWIGLIAVGLTLGAAGCSGGSGEKTTPVKDPAAIAYGDRMLAFLKTTSQGAHVTRLTVRKDGSTLFADVDTDLQPAKGQATAAQQNDRQTRDKLAVEASDWGTDHREIAVRLIRINTADHGEFSIGNVPPQDEEHAKRDVYTGDLLDQLHNSADGGYVTRIRMDVTSGNVVLTVETSLKPREAATPAGDQHAISSAILNAAVNWAQTATEYTVNTITVADVEKGALDSAQVAP
jgi:hypothetical protein